MVLGFLFGLLSAFDRTKVSEDVWIDLTEALLDYFSLRYCESEIEPRNSYV